MSLLTQMREDAANFSGNTGEFSSVADFTAPDTSTELNVPCLHVKHHTGFTDTGERVNTMIASVTVSETILAANGYPTRNAANDVDMANHRVTVTDPDGEIYNYIVREFYPDETFAIIVLILGEWV